MRALTRLLTVPSAREVEIELAADIRATCKALSDDRSADVQMRLWLARAVGDLEAATAHLVFHHGTCPELTAAAAVPFLMLAGCVVGGWMLAGSALAAACKGTGDIELSFAAVYATQVLPETAAFLAQVPEQTHEMRVLPTNWRI